MDRFVIAHTTIPWTLRWLFHYENWLSTGVWLGDDAPPIPEVPNAAPNAALERPQ
jgi:hypothetical protein